ncbi:MAG: hypothetical protein HRF42_13675 [Candidatus Brocadia sp.]|jgi:hypothetical protein
MSTTVTPLLPGKWYHIYNRGINGETIYHTEANYQYFLDLLAKYVFHTAKVYIHNNPRHHGIMNDIAKYQYSSYRTVLSSVPTKIEREEVLSWFGGRDSFVAYHSAGRDDISNDLILE